jgi:hypothetical protein
MTERPSGKDECKGCKFNQGFQQLCFFRSYGVIDKCPCIECLVKIMCLERCLKRSNQISLNQRLNNEE